MTAPRTSLAATALALTVAALSPVTVTAPAQAAETDRILTTRWSSDAQLKAGTRRGLDVVNGALRIADRPAGTTKVSDPYTSAGKRDYEYGRWASPWVSTGFAARALIPSWNAVARKRTFLRIHLRTSNGSTVSSWDKVAEWGMKTEGVHRHSGPAQADDLNQLLTDTLVSNGGSTMQRWQLRITLLRPVGASGSLPRVHSVGGVASSFRTRSQTVSPTTMTAARELSVPRASQMEHSGHFPQWGNGGQAWCSPTSMSMVLRYWGRGPRPRDYAWAHAEGGEVDYAARYTYDHAYRGTGNWPFNTAYASNYGLDAFVTRLRNLRDAEAFIKAGIPVVTSLAFGRGELTGSPISSTNGHLMVVIGFTADGRVIVNDPAASSESGVRRVYQRGQFERAWLGGSGGVTYVVRPADRALPQDTTRW